MMVPGDRETGLFIQSRPALVRYVWISLFLRRNTAVR